MSLINEALRKTQNQRASAPGLGNEPTLNNPAINYAGRQGPSGLMIGLGICIFILIGLVAGLTAMLLLKEATSPVQQTAAPVEPAAHSGESNQPPTPEASLEIAAPAIPDNTPATPEPPIEQISEIIEEPVVVAKPDPKIRDWLAQSTVTGLRITKTSSKVILNNKAYIPGDTANTELGLKVLTIEKNRILFIDANSIEYEKSL